MTAGYLLWLQYFYIGRSIVYKISVSHPSYCGAGDEAGPHPSHPSYPPISTYVRTYCGKGSNLVIDYSLLLIHQRLFINFYFTRHKNPYSYQLAT